MSVSQGNDRAEPSLIGSVRIDETGLRHRFEAPYLGDYALGWLPVFAPVDADLPFEAVDEWGNRHRIEFARANPRTREMTTSATVTDAYTHLYSKPDGVTTVFSMARGVPVSIRSSGEWHYGRKALTRNDYKLVAQRRLDAEELARLVPEWETYRLADRAIRQAIPVEDPAAFDAAQSVGEIERIAREALARITRRDLRKALEKARSSSVEAVDWLKETAAKDAALIGQRVAEYGRTLQSYNGDSRRLADFEGKVLVLDYWYRGCGSCMRAMPDLIALSREFANDPVVVLGMSTDRKPEDARFVIEHFRIPFPVMAAGGHDESMGITLFPTVLVLDGTGAVRSVHHGAGTHDAIRRSVKRLLAEKDAAAEGDMARPPGS